jgi:hypothetical protein
VIADNNAASAWHELLSGWPLWLKIIVVSVSLILVCFVVFGVSFLIIKRDMEVQIGPKVSRQRDLKQRWKRIAVWRAKRPVSGIGTLAARFWRCRLKWRSKTMSLPKYARNALRRERVKIAP